MIKIYIPNKNEHKTQLLLERIPYISESITGLQYHDQTQELHIYVKEELYTEEIRKSIDSLVEAIETIKVNKEKILYDNTMHTLHANGTAKQVHRKSVGSNKLFYDEQDLAIMNALDARFLKIASKYNAILREYPSILSYENMKKNHYHRNFPQNVYAVSEIPHRQEVIDQICKGNDDEMYSEQLIHKGDFLQPCLCYHCYEEMQGKRLTGSQVFTAKGRCFRHEIEWRLDHYRYKEFTMREIVFILNPRSNYNEEGGAISKAS